MDETRSLIEWKDKPKESEKINTNLFRQAVRMAYEGRALVNPMDPEAEDRDKLELKIARLLPYNLIIPAGDVIYIMDDGKPIPLNDGMDLLRAYLSVSMKDTERAAHILEQNFMGKWPVDAGLIEDNCYDLHNYTVDLLGDTASSGGSMRINLRDNKCVEEEHMGIGKIPELGSGSSNKDRVKLLDKVFSIWNDAIGEENFFEKLSLFPIKREFREKAFILNGTGGDGKGIYTNLLSRLYGHLMLPDAPIPSFSGHDKFTATRSFIGKKFVVFNDVESPSTKFMEWLKPMTTGKMMVKELNSSSLVSMPCAATFMLETNFTPEFLMDNSHIRRFILRTFPEDFELNKELSNDELDILGERGDITSADMVDYLLSKNIDDWITFKQVKLPAPWYFELADEVTGEWTNHMLQTFCLTNKLEKQEKQALKRKLEKEGKL